MTSKAVDSARELLNCRSWISICMEHMLAVASAQMQLHDVHKTRHAFCSAHLNLLIQKGFCVQNDVDSQYAELLSQSEADMSVTKLDEGEIEREIRELSQNLLQMQQELMSAQAECDRAQSAEQDALSTWEAKRSAQHSSKMVAQMLMQDMHTA